MEYSHLLNKIIWSPPELYHKSREIYRRPELRHLEIPFQMVLREKLLQSYFGCFLKEFNFDEKHDEETLLQKLGMLHFDILHQHDKVFDRMMQPEVQTIVSAKTKKKKVSVKGNRKKAVKTKVPIEQKDPVLDYCLEKAEDLTFRKNNFTDDVLELLKTLILENGEVQMSNLYKKLKILRIIDSKITVLDYTLKKFTNLQLLNLSCNWLKDVSGKFLPKRLRFLELYGNFISNLSSLCCKYLPPGLIYLGLGHNSLTNGCGLHLLSMLNNNEHLRILDISDNDILNLPSTLSALKPLKHLISLKLDGNPCAMSLGYKDCVVEMLPKLKYLDNTEFLESDYQVNPDYNSLLHDNSGALVFTCYRVIGLTPPPSEKFKNEPADSWFYFEIEAPLIDSSYIKAIQEQKIQLEEEEDEEVEVVREKENGKILKELKKAKTRTTIHTKKSNKRPKTVYQKIDEYVTEIGSPIKKTYLQSERIKYSKGLQFPEPTIVVDVDENLIALRDTFRSQVTARLIYLVTKKLSPKSKTVIPLKKKKSSKGKPVESNKTESEINKNNPESEKEIIVKKITIAEILCNLQQVNWSDQYIDFYWDETDPINGIRHEAIFVDGSLKAINYVNKLPKKQNEKKSGRNVNNKKKPEMNSQSKLTTNTEVVWPPKSESVLRPKILTIQLGFGLKRISKDVLEGVSTQRGKDKTKKAKK